MKKRSLCLVLATVFLLSVSSMGWAGICLDSTSYCNDAFLQFAPAGGSVYSLTGYESGCGYDDRLAYGSMVLAGGVAYIGFTQNNGNSVPFDAGSSNNQNYEVSLGSFTGSYLSSATYLSGGVPSGHTWTDTVVLSICTNPPPTAAAADADPSVE